MANLVFGEEITAAQVEELTSDWTAERFARLCNVVVFALAWRRGSGKPAFTERVNVADNGIDAEMHLTVGEDAAPGDTSYLVRGLNVLQYKKHDIRARNRAKIISDLKSGLKGEAGRVKRGCEDTVKSYTVFPNVDVTPGQQRKIRTAIAFRLRKDDPLRDAIGVIGAAELASFLNELPHIKTAFFGTAPFRTWGDAWESLNIERAFGAGVDLVGRNEELEALRSWIDSPGVRVITVSGPHMMGKSRLILEATRDRDTTVVESLQRDGLSISDLLAITSPSRITRILFNDPDWQMAEELAAAALAQPTLQLIFMVPFPVSGPKPNFGTDERCQYLHLDPLGHEDSRKLIAAAKGKMDFSLESWVIDQAAGVPGIILAAVAEKDTLRASGEAFMTQVAKTFDRRASGQLSNAEYQVLSLFSLMSHVGVWGAVKGETETLCRYFNVDLHEAIKAIGALHEKAWIRVSGDFVEVVPPFLGNYLAQKELGSRIDIIVPLLEDLEGDSQSRLFRRLVYLSGQEIAKLWNQLFAPDGLFGSLENLIHHARLFEEAAAAVPGRAGPILLRLLSPVDRISVREIPPDARRSIVWALDKLLSYEASSEDALRTLANLASAETETIGNNATGVFNSAFFPLHPQVPLPLRRRQILMAEMFESSDVTAMMLAVDAAQHALQESQTTSLRPSAARHPLGSMPSMTWSDVRRYQRDALALLRRAASSSELKVRATALRYLPNCAGRAVEFGLEDDGFEILDHLIDLAEAGDKHVNATSLSDTLNLVRRRSGDLRGQLDLKDPFQAERATVLEATIEMLGVRLERLKTGPFELQIKRHLGGWLHDYDDEEGLKSHEKEAAEIEALAKETCRTPEALNDQLLDWLDSQEASRAAEFWRDVGRQDIDRHWFPILTERAKEWTALHAFTSYLQGWASVAKGEALDQFYDVADQLDPRIAFASIVYAGDNEEGADFLCKIVSTSRIDTEWAARILSSWAWLEHASPERVTQVLRCIAGNDFQHAEPIIDLIAFYLHGRKDFPDELAAFTWELLEKRPRLDDSNVRYHCDEVAAKLVKLDEDRAFALLDLSLKGEHTERSWIPIDKFGQRKFWGAILAADPVRAIRALVEMIAASDDLRFEVHFHVSGLIDPVSEKAAVIELARFGEKEAAIVASLLSYDSEGFWRAAFDLVEMYPESNAVKHELECRIEEMGEGHWGRHSDHLNTCRERVAKAIEEQTPPDNARIWLKDFETRLQSQIDQRRREEANQDIIWP